MKIRALSIEGVAGEPQGFWQVKVLAWEGCCAMLGDVYDLKLYQNKYPTAKQIKAAIKNIVEPKDL